MSQDKKNKEEEQAKLDEFFEEVKKNNLSEDNEVQLNTKNLEKRESYSNVQDALRYKCPHCGRLLTSRKEPCKYCGYAGYIPMNEEQTKGIRRVLFVVILILAIVVIILNRQ